MKVKVEFKDGSVETFENVNYIAEDCEQRDGEVNELIGICFFDDSKEDIDIYKKDIKSVSTYEEYRNGTESWRDKEDSKQ